MPGPDPTPQDGTGSGHLAAALKIKSVLVNLRFGVQAGVAIAQEFKPFRFPEAFGKRNVSFKVEIGRSDRDQLGDPGCFRIHDRGTIRAGFGRVKKKVKKAFKDSGNRFSQEIRHSLRQVATSG